MTGSGQGPPLRAVLGLFRREVEQPGVGADAVIGTLSDTSPVYALRWSYRKHGANTEFAFSLVLEREFGMGPDAFRERLPLSPPQRRDMSGIG
ncbi:hypothetical protein B4N89_41055 [Embleya scabrispora]|uniref:Uncharacterized protein n=1 Tax=Embleya scabrispora TaxID=159449 RepID=A0A1T3NK26_9ACTN|nr:hypothetical protein [Embleya scabrispora]OPC76981.1 hypothetical protein B4N89_41055 [Embleya scabrispora]